MDETREVLVRQFPILEFFAYAHLPTHLQRVSQPLGDLAHTMALAGKDRPAECAAGLRKLLEAKDCFVRAALPRRVE
jgi:hypothetical protein